MLWSIRFAHRVSKVRRATLLRVSTATAASANLKPDAANRAWMDTPLGLTPSGPAWLAPSVVAQRAVLVGPATPPESPHSSPQALFTPTPLDTSPPPPPRSDDGAGESSSPHSATRRAKSRRLRLLQKQEAESLAWQENPLRVSPRGDGAGATRLQPQGIQVPGHTWRAPASWRVNPLQALPAALRRASQSPVAAAWRAASSPGGSPQPQPLSPPSPQPQPLSPPSPGRSTVGLAGEGEGPGALRAVLRVQRELGDGCSDTQAQAGGGGPSVALHLHAPPDPPTASATGVSAAEASGAVMVENPLRRSALRPVAADGPQASASPASWGSTTSTTSLRRPANAGTAASPLVGPTSCAVAEGVDGLASSPSDAGSSSTARAGSAPVTQPWSHFARRRATIAAPSVGGSRRALLAEDDSEMGGCGVPAPPPTPAPPLAPWMPAGQGLGGT